MLIEKDTAKRRNNMKPLNKKPPKKNLKLPKGSDHKQPNQNRRIPVLLRGLCLHFSFINKIEENSVRKKILLYLIQKSFK